MYKYYRTETWNGRTVNRVWVDEAYIDDMPFRTLIFIFIIITSTSILCLRAGLHLWFIPCSCATVLIGLLIWRYLYVKHKLAKLIAYLQTSNEQKQLEKQYNIESYRLYQEFKRLQEMHFANMTPKNKERYDLLKKTEGFN